MPKMRKSVLCLPNCLHHPMLKIEEVETVMEALNVADDRSRLDAFIKNKQKMKRLESACSGDFELEKEIGRGVSGVVDLVKYRSTSSYMARKSIHLEVKQRVMKQIMRELQILHDCSSEHIVGYYGTYSCNDEINICMEYMDGGSLSSIMQKTIKFPANILSQVSQSVLCGLKYLKEKHQIIHRDVKPSNILMSTGGQIKLCDFGVSGELVNSQASTFVGTRSYMAPERISGTNYSIAADIWSLGLTLVELALGFYPVPYSRPEIKDIVECKTEAVEEDQLCVFDLLQRIVCEEPAKLPKKHFSEQMCLFTDACLKRDPDKRKTLIELLSMKFITCDATSMQDVANWVCNNLNLQPPR